MTSEQTTTLGGGGCCGCGRGVGRGEEQGEQGLEKTESEIHQCGEMTIGKKEGNESFLEI